MGLWNDDNNKDIDYLLKTFEHLAKVNHITGNPCSLFTMGDEEEFGCKNLDEFEWEDDDIYGLYDDESPFTHENGRKKRKLNMCFVWETVNWEYLVYLVASCIPWACTKEYTKVPEKRE